MTLIVVGLDALDAELINYFDIDAYRLETSTELDTFAHSRDVPYTLEVWPTVVTGVGPEEHGITGSGTSDWTNPLLEFGSKLTGRLPEGTRGKLGRITRDLTGEREQLAETDVTSVFDVEGGVVHNWPGVHDGSDLQRAWDLMGAVTEGMGRREFERELFGLCAQQFGWAREMCHHTLKVAGVHVHTLDAAGHAYSDDEEALKAVYERVGEFVSQLHTSLGSGDDLLLLSDHGMQTAFLDGDSGHSFRAFAATTADECPTDVFDVADWIESRYSDIESDKTAVDMPEDQLRQLGYIE